MATFLVRRTFNALLLVLVSASLGFFVLHVIPGDPFGMTLGQAGRSAEILTQLRSRYGLDESVTQQYVHYISRAAVGDFGTSLVDSQPVIAALRSALANSLLLGITALLLAIALGVSIGALQGWKPKSLLGRVLGGALTVFYAAPEFIVAIALITIFAFKWTLFPVGGLNDPLVGIVGTRSEQLRDQLWHLALPALTLAIGWGAAIARQQRATLRELAGEDHVRSARAKGATSRLIFLRHGLRPSLPAVVVVIGLMMPELLGGAVIVETLFSWPGVGSLLLKSIAARDYPMVSAAIVAVGLLVAFGSLFTDVLIAALDPRMRTAATA